MNHPTQAHCRAVPAPLQQWGVRSCAENGVWELGTGGSGGKEGRLALSQPSSLQLQGFRGCRSVGAGGHTHLALIKVFNDLVVQSLFQLALRVQVEAMWVWHGGCI